MQKLFYVVGRWLEEDNSRQSTRILDMIKPEMQNVGFNYESIKNTQRQREQLYREREKLIREKQKLEEQKRQIEQEREHNIRLIEEKQKLQRQREMIEQRLHNEKEQAQELKEENQELEEKRKTMVEEYQKLQDERDKIIEERQLLFERMEKIEKLQKLQRMYQEQLKRLREQAQNQGQPLEQQKNCEEEQNEIDVIIPKTEQTSQEPKSVSSQHSNQTNYSVPYPSGFSTTIYTRPPQYTTQPSFSSQQYRYTPYIPSTQYVGSSTSYSSQSPSMTSFSTQTNSASTNTENSSNTQTQNTHSQQTRPNPYAYYSIRRNNSQNQENPGQNSNEQKK